MCDAPDSVDGRAPAPDPDTSSELTFNIPTMYNNQQKFCTKNSANMYLVYRKLKLQSLIDSYYDIMS